MWRPVEIALRFVAIGILLLLTGALLKPPAPGGSPYVSALADLTVGTVLAGQGCGYNLSLGGSRSGPRRGGNESCGCS